MFPTPSPDDPERSNVSCVATTSPHRIAAFFDLDKTVIARSSTLIFTRHFYDGGLLTKRGMLRSAIVQLQLLLTSAGPDHVAKLRKHVTDMCTGWHAGTVRAIVSETLDEAVRPVIFAEAADLIAGHQAAGHDVVLISASGMEMVEPIGELLGVDAVRATVMEVVDGHYSGEIEFYCYGEEKAHIVRELAAEYGYDLESCYAYSDSSTDLPMLSAVGHPAVVNPDKSLRAAAQGQGWEIFDFPNPAPHLEWLRPAKAAWCAAGVGAVAAALIAYGAAHRHLPRPAAA